MWSKATLSSHPRCTSDDALRQLADDVYYSSLMVGRKHIDTSGGYFQLGNVFYSMNKVENALAMYDKVVDIWYKCVTQFALDGRRALRTTSPGRRQGR